MLLELNAMLMKQSQDGFGLDAESGSLIRHCICPFAMLDASVLARQMVTIGAEASAWLSASFPEMRDAGADGGQRSDPIDLSNELKAGTYARPTPILWG